MPDSDLDSRLDEMERDNLQSAVSSAERAILSAGAEVPQLLRAFVENTKGRIGQLDKKIKDKQTEREAHLREQVAGVAYLAEQEAALTASEKQTYSGFLGKPFFTKNDFENLDQFYGSTWDRLSQSGKDEMSQRVWEGVRRNEYAFSELPKSVREKESEQAYKRLTNSSIGIRDDAKIPVRDREDFIKAYEAGQRDEAAKVLDRDSFKEQMFRRSDSKGVKQIQAEVGKAPAESAIGSAVVRNEPPYRAPDATKGTGNAATEASGLNLKGLKLAESTKEPSAADMPSSEARANIRSI